ncbi:YqzM family protein [Bacillaceae bacterium S4-13-58]
MNEFEKNVQSRNDDIADSARGFLYSFLFFMVIFFIATTIEVAGSF